MKYGAFYAMLQCFLLSQTTKYLKLQNNFNCNMPIINMVEMNGPLRNCEVISH